MQSVLPGTFRSRDTRSNISVVGVVSRSQRIGIDSEKRSRSEAEQCGPLLSTLVPRARFLRIAVSPRG